MRRSRNLRQGGSSADNVFFFLISFLCSHKLIKQRDPREGLYQYFKENAVYIEKKVNIDPPEKRYLNDGAVGMLWSVIVIND